MVRINIIDPKSLSDQHLIAEYDEILMLLGYVKRYPVIKYKKGISEIPKSYTLGRGHIKFFKDKLLYIKNRHEDIKNEMKLRGFKTSKTINIKDYPKALCNDYEPKTRDIKIIKERIISKILQKPGYYKYYKENKGEEFLVEIISKSN